ncbi:lipoprotein signal peptidase [Georgenia satyanarayanai]|uniref:Lipoprotein signal peptidase n=1 Tax=Georgenia satyanarayanai TaxID=860221 RepID=A0A2Y9BY09_9MICO|nr:signal peptidase II [Georgenia satyanarayanai]PYF99820.1 lipoprotein signal peptidase [Georgenia satyanarayanai]SSA41802.1 lipoprotein signal peptidase [Georgenia satyanarayanai]
MTQQQRGRRGMVILLVALALGIAGIDQATKYLAEERLTQGVYIPLVGDLLGWQLIYNPGAAFSFGTGMTWVFTVIMVVVIVVVLRVARRLRSAAWALALGMLLGGAVGNLYDRLLREPGFARGHVVDFINYNGWFVGNVADIAIVLAAVLIAVLALLGIEVDGTRVVTPRDDEDAAPADDDGEPLSEEPLVDETDFSPEVPRATDDDGVDVATWVSGARSAAATPAPAGEAPAPAPAAPTWSAVRPAAETEPAGEAATSGERTGPAEAVRRRPRSRREIRLTSSDDDA